MSVVDVIRGNGPIVLAMPHTGTGLPDGMQARLNENGLRLADTDWHVDRLYDGLLPHASVVRATFHRYVIDANRDPSGKSLYPGQNTTALCPLTDFDGAALYKVGHEPDAAEIEHRRVTYHEPYNAALSAELVRAKATHGLAVLYDCHSIRSRIPFLFDGILPDFNIGTNDGRSCARDIEQQIASICGSAEGYSSIVNGRFKGGWTTRHYGNPAVGVHAVQMELAQKTHLRTEAAPFSYDEKKAAQLRGHLASILETLDRWARTMAAAEN